MKADPPTFFKNAAAFRKWLSEHHDRSDVLWVGYYKKATGIKSITWPESVDEALCFGWIDGIRKRIDEQCYTIRFTPRRKNSHWSNVNLERVKTLLSEGRMQPAGIAAYERRNKNRMARAAHEQGDVQLDPAYERELRANHQAWQFFDSKAPSYKKQCIWWIMSAKRPDTRSRRLSILIDCCEEGKNIPPLART